MIRVEVEQGKYKFLVDEGKIRVLRWNDPWIRDFKEGGKAIIGLLSEHEEAINKLEDIKDTIEKWNDPKHSKETLQLIKELKANLR